MTTPVRVCVGLAEVPCWNLRQAMTLSLLGRRTAGTTKIVDTNGFQREVTVPQLATMVANAIIRPEV